MLRADGGIIFRLIRPVQANADILTVRDSLHKNRFHGNIGMHRGGDGLPTERHNDARYIFPDGVGSIHGDRPLDGLHLDGDRLADRQGHLSKGQDNAYDEGAQQHAPYDGSVPCLHDLHSDNPSLRNINPIY